MKRSTHVKWGELKVGILIFIAVVAMLWASFSGGGTSIFDSKAKFRAYFANVNGLVTGAPVWISGIEVGNVSDMKFVNLDSARQIEITIRVLQSIRNMLTSDAKVRLGTIGLLGDKYIEILPGTYGMPMLQEGEIILTAPTADLSAVLEQSESAMTHARQFITNLDSITNIVRRGEGTAGRLITDEALYVELTRLVSSMTILVEGLQEDQKKITSSLANMSNNLDSISAAVKDQNGTIGKLVGDPGLYDRLHSSTARIDSILGKINAGRGTAGALVNDEILYEELKNLIVRIESLVGDIEKNPKKYFKFSVF